MNEQLSSMSGGLLGLLIGAVLALIVCIILKRYNKKNRLYDERQTQVRLQGKSASWNITLVALLIAWAYVLIYEGMSLSFYLVGGIYFIHCISFIITTIYYNQKN